MKKTNYIELTSVGSIIELKTGNIYPCGVDGKPDLNVETNLTEISDEWLSKLRGTDEMIVGTWLKLNSPQTLVFGNDH
mgnify:FL=1